MNQITFNKTKEEITIKIPVDLLKHVAEYFPMEHFVVNDEQVFAEKIMFQLEHGLTNGEVNDSGFKDLIDRAIIAVVESGHDCIDYKTDVKQQP